MFVWVGMGTQLVEVAGVLVVLGLTELVLLGGQV